MPVLDVELVPALQDNYVYLIRDPDAGTVGIVDPAEAGPAIAALERRGLRPDYVLNTHHHPDHVGGNAELKARYGCPIVGPRADAARIPGIDVALGDGDEFGFGAHRFTVFDTPGHTRGHVSLWFAEGKALFCGDTLFALGCGRLFEGTPEQMWRSLLKLRALPDDTRVFCGHEYTLSNARFAVTVDPGNDALRRRAEEVKARRDRGEPTIPSTLGEEKATNPFLRADDPGVQAAVGLPGADPVEVFAEVRRRKDGF